MSDEDDTDQNDRDPNIVNNVNNDNDTSTLNSCQSSTRSVIGGAINNHLNAISDLSNSTVQDSSLSSHPNPPLSQSVHKDKRIGVSQRSSLLSNRVGGALDVLQNSKRRIQQLHPSTVPSPLSESTPLDSAEARVQQIHPSILPTSSTQQVSISAISSSDHSEFQPDAQTNVEEIMVPQATQVSSSTHQDVQHLAAQVAERITVGWNSLLQEEIEIQMGRQASLPEGDTSRTERIPEVSVTVIRNNKNGFWIVACMVTFLLLISGAVVGTVVGLRSPPAPFVSPQPTIQWTVPPTRTPTSMPTPSSNLVRVDLIDRLSPFIAPNNASEEWALLSDPTTPQSRALNWLSEQDEEAWTLREPDRKLRVLVERYAIAVLYYSIGDSSNSLPSQLSFLDPTTSVCQWNNGGMIGDRKAMGVFCGLSDGYEFVTSIQLQDLSLIGTIPWEISWLEYLQVLWLYRNHLHGTLPSLSMPSLQYLTLSDNNLNGVLPMDWSNSMPDLVVLELAQNLLEGSIPSDIGDLSHLTALVLYQNYLNESLPSTLGRLTMLQQLYLHQNYLSGTLPSELGNLERLIDLYVSRNTLLHGTVPIEFTRLESL